MQRDAARAARSARFWIVAGLLGALGCAGCGSPAPHETLEAWAARIHREAIVVDTHADTTPRFQSDSWNFGERHSRSDSHVDLPRMREGGLDVEFWSIYTGKADAPGEAMRIALQRIDAVHEMIARHPDDMALARSAADVRRIVAEGRIASLMGVEGGHMIEDDLAVLRDFYRLGARYLTLTHSFHTGWADSSGTSTVPEPEHGGLTAFGEEVVAEMNRLGMLVDVSHVADETFRDVIRVSRAPVIASHSSCRAIADHTRNMTDEMLISLAANGGVIMINFYPAYIDANASRETKEYFETWKDAFAAIAEAHPDDRAAQRAAQRAHFLEHPVPQTDLDVLLDHFDHAIAVAGEDHVGIGADWDGVPSMPRGMEDVSALPRLTLELLRRGHSEATVRKVLGENLLRVLAEAERIGARIRGEQAIVAAGSGGAAP